VAKLKTWDKLCNDATPHPKSAYAHLPMRTALKRPAHTRRARRGAKWPIFTGDVPKHPKSFFRVTKEEHEAYLRVISSPIPLMEK